MALGYEGVIKLGSTYALGTGTSVPSARIRLESSSGYGGNIKTPLSEMGVGLPHNYDWSQYDGSLNFDITPEIITNELKPWLKDRQSARTVEFSSRSGNVQKYINSFWNNINIDAGGENSPVTGSVGFIALSQDTYTWGNSYIGNKTGMNLFPCSGGTFPSPLNDSVNFNKHPVPFWNTTVSVGSNFLQWTVDFSQDVVKFFGCFGGGSETTAVEPKYLAVGPMTITFTGTYMQTAGGGYLGDSLAALNLTIGGVTIGLERLELTTEQDDVQTGDSLVPLSVEYVAYEIAAA